MTKRVTAPRSGQREEERPKPRKRQKRRSAERKEENNQRCLTTKLTLGDARTRKRQMKNIREENKRKSKYLAYGCIRAGLNPPYCAMLTVPRPLMAILAGPRTAGNSSAATRRRKVDKKRSNA